MVKSENHHEKGSFLKMKFLITYRLDEYEEVCTTEVLVEADSVSSMSTIIENIEKRNTIINIENITFHGGKRFNDKPDIVLDR